MTLELIAVDGCTIDHASGSLISGGAFVITSIPSLLSKAEAKGVFKTPLAFTFSGGDASGFVNGSVTGGGTVVSSCLYNKAENVLVVLDGDVGTLTATGTLPPPGGGTGPVVGSVEITDPNQTKAKAQ